MYLSGSFLALVATLLAAVAVWYASMRAREAANRLAADACRRRSLQLLDGTVALSGLRPRLAEGGLRLQRTYVFDFTADGVSRASGFIIMLGRRMQHIGLDDESRYTVTGEHDGQR